MTTLVAPLTLRIPTVQEVDIGVIPYLIHMGKAGIQINTEKLANFAYYLKGKMETEQQKAWVITGYPFNLGSNHQVAKLLFIEMGLPPLKMTKGGQLSVNEEVLEEIKADLVKSRTGESEHQIKVIEYILEYRRLSKVKGTYADGLVKQGTPISDTHAMLYPWWLGWGAETGRLACRNPNVMNQPERDKDSRDAIKGSYEPRPGYVYIACDYAQIELKVLAHIANDLGMIKAFWNKADIHTDTAMEAFGILDPKLVSSTQRRDAKIVNFGIVFGLSPMGLVGNIPPEERDPNIHTLEWAEEFIDRFLFIRPGVAQYMMDTKAFVRANGYVKDIVGRIRRIPEATLNIGNMVSDGERAAINMPVQAGAQAIMKIAMGLLLNLGGTGYLDSYVERGDVLAIMQVHDELIFEVRKGLVYEVAMLVKEVMEGAAPWLAVPLTCDVEFSDKSWADIHGVENLEELKGA